MTTQNPAPLAGVISALAGGFLFIAFYRMGELTGAHALIGLAAVTAAAWIGYLASETSSNAESRRPPTRAFGGDQLLQIVVAAIPDPALALDRDGRVLALNARARASPRPCAAASRYRWRCALPMWSTRSARAASSGKPERVEFVERVPPGRWLEALISPIGAQGEPKPDRAGMLLVIFHDLTPMRRVEEMRADFVANASHELRTPLAALLGLHRDAARPGARRRGRARALPRHHGSAGDAHGAADRRPAVAVADRAQRASAAGQAGRSLPASCGRSPTGCRRCRAIASVEVKIDGAAGAAHRAGRPRRTDPRVREPDRERAEIRRLRQAGRDHVSRRGKAPDGRGGSRASPCAITARASPPSICRA